MDSGFWKKFFSGRDDTGRYVVVSNRTGVMYLVEPIDSDPHRQRWGDLNPATGQVEGSYGEKYRGSIHPEDSLITEENGVRNIVSLRPGESPESYIERADAGYPDKKAV